MADQVSKNLVVERSRRVGRSFERAWTEAARAGEQATKDMLVEGLNKLPSSAPAEVVVAFCYGALTSLGDALRVMVDPRSIATTEQYALAHLRGALRGAEEAVRDDGKPFTGTTNA